MIFNVPISDNIKTDYCIIGAGIAGLSAAYYLPKNASVLLVSKEDQKSGATFFAQGGIAAAISEDDTPQFHISDTLSAGAGLCDPNAVSVLAEEGPSCIQDLLNLGVPFDKNESGKPALAQEAAHGKRRILHALDKTGKVISSYLGKAVLAQPNVQFFPFSTVAYLCVVDGVCNGCILERNGKWIHVQANAVILASGGYSHIYHYYTNPNTSSGEGILLAYQAGAAIRDMEFVQFHPTAFIKPDGKGVFLISEVVRGEGAILRNTNGERFMSASDTPGQELAPRNVVSLAIFNEMSKTKSPFVYLDVSSQKETFANRFPSIFNCLNSYNMDLFGKGIPVTPAAHYCMGGVQTDLWGQTTLKGLFAIGEVACNGVHGANRLASNSLLEGLVFGHRVAEYLSNATYVFKSNPISGMYPLYFDSFSGSVKSSQDIQRRAWEEAGILRSEKRLASFLNWIQSDLPKEATFNPAYLTQLSKQFCATKLAEFALLREESRGAHFRLDFPAPNPKWSGYLSQQKGASIQIHSKIEA